MGTRADFYLGIDGKAEWLGSIGWDGYPEGIADFVMLATNAEDFRANVNSFLSEREDATLQEQGWPWPWDDSSTTDYAYMFDGSRVLISCFGSNFYLAGMDEDDEAINLGAPEFPDFSGKDHSDEG